MSVPGALPEITDMTTDHRIPAPLVYTVHGAGWLVEATADRKCRVLLQAWNGGLRTFKANAEDVLPIALIDKWPPSELKFESNLEQGILAPPKKARRFLKLPNSYTAKFRSERHRNLIIGPVVGPAPPVTICKPSRRGMRAVQRIKKIVQLWDSDRNRDIGYTHDSINQGYNHRTDEEARANEVADVSGRGIIRLRTFTVDKPDGRADEAALLSSRATNRHGEPASYTRGRSRVRLDVPTGLNKRGREYRRLLKVLEYMQKGISVRRTAQLMHITETEVKKYRRQIRQGLGSRYFSRDERGRFERTL